MGTLGGGGGGGRTVPTSNVERQQCYPSSRSRGVARSTFCVHRLIPSEFNHQGRMRVDVLIAIFGACFILGHSGVDALECYVCNSYTDSRCSEKVPHSSLLQKCDLVPGAGAKYTMCRKTVQTIEFRVNGLPPETRVIRTCGYDESNYKGKCYQRGGFGGRQEVCSCLTDKCNSATKIFEKAPHFVLMLLCIIGTAARTFVGN